MPETIPTVPAQTEPQIPLAYQRALDLVNDLMHDRDFGPGLRKKAKEKYPDVRFPEDSIDPVIEPLSKRLDELQKTLSEEREERKKEREAAAEKTTKQRTMEALDAARRNYNLTDEGFDKMVARMKETGNYSDADAAAAWVISKEPPPAPPGPTWAPKMLDMKGSLDEATVKLLHTNPEGYQDAQLAEFLKDPDKYVRDTFGAAA